MSNKDSIGFRLRKELDEDIKNAVANLPQKVVSDLCRNGLRLMLGIRTTKCLTVAEQPLNVPPTPEQPKITPPQTRPTVFVNQKKG